MRMLGFETLVAASSRANPVDILLELQRSPTDESASAMRLSSSRGTTIGFLLICAALIAFIVCAALWLGLTSFVLALVAIASLVYFEILQPRKLCVTFNPHTDELIIEIAYLTRHSSQRWRLSNFDSFELKCNEDWRGRPVGQSRLFVASPRQRVPVMIPGVYDPNELRAIARTIKTFVGWHAIA